MEVARNEVFPDLHSLLQISGLSHCLRFASRAPQALKMIKPENSQLPLLLTWADERWIERLDAVCRHDDLEEEEMEYVIAALN